MSSKFRAAAHLNEPPLEELLALVRTEMKTHREIYLSELARVSHGDTDEDGSTFTLWGEARPDHAPRFVFSEHAYTDGAVEFRITEEKTLGRLYVRVLVEHMREVGHSCRREHLLRELFCRAGWTVTEEDADEIERAADRLWNEVENAHPLPLASKK